MNCAQGRRFLVDFLSSPYLRKKFQNGAITEKINHPVLDPVFYLCSRLFCDVLFAVCQLYYSNAALYLLLPGEGHGFDLIRSFTNI